MAEHDTQPSKAEQRQLAVEKLRRAGSLPRMKGGRRPPMHVEAVSVEDISPPQELVNEPEPEQKPDQDIGDRTVSPGPAGRSKRRSRSRSRSRGSRDFKNNARHAQSPVPPAGDSSQDDEEPPIPLPSIALPLALPNLSPIPNPLSPFQKSHFSTPDPSMSYPGFSPPTPIPLPTLEALQRGLFRSNSASSAAGRRRQALARLTGSADIYDPSPSASPTPPFSNGGLSRNNTVSGGERIAARQLMLNRLNGRLAKEAEAEASGSEERGASSSMPKRRRRRPRGNPMRALNVTGTLDAEDSSQSVDVPVPPHLFNARPPDSFAELRAQSTTPMQTSSSQDQDSDSPSEEAPATAEGIVSSPAGQARRRSILVEEDEDEDENIGALNGEAEEQEKEETPQQQQPSQYRYPGLPATPRIPPHASPPREPHLSDPSSQGSAESAPLIYNQRTPSRHDVFPKSPFNSPLKERPSEEEERVLYYHNTFRARTPFADIHTDGHGRKIDWVGDPVPIMVEDDSDEEDGQEDEDKYAEDDDMWSSSSEEPVDEDGAFEEPLSPTSSDAPQKDGSFSPQPSSQSVHAESERSPDIPAVTSSMPSSGVPVPLSQSIDESRMSPQPFPARLSIRPRTSGGSDKSPLPGDEWDEQSTLTKRNGEHTSPSTWDKLKGVFSRRSTGRRSRSNSLAARERRDNVDSSISRESGASLTSAKNDKVSEGGGQQPQAPPVMQTPSASASILSLSPHGPTRGGASPIPPATTADFAKYHNAKLFPFPGIQKLEEQRNRVRAARQASHSSSDVSTAVVDGDQPPPSAQSYHNNAKLFPFPGIQKLEEQRNRVRAAGQASHSSFDVSTAVVDGDQPPPSARSYHNTTALTPEPPRERKLSHQVSDSRERGAPSDNDGGGSQQPHPSVDESTDLHPQCHVLMLEVAMGVAQKKLLVEDMGSQLVVDFLSKELLDHRNTVLSKSERKSILQFLAKLVKLTRIFPQSLELKNVQCDLLYPVAEGGFGYIYKGVYEGRPVCIKTVRVFEQHKHSKQRLRAQAGEVTVWAHLRHQNVLPFLGIYVSDEKWRRVCIVSPWMENGDLLRYLRDHPDAPRTPLLHDIISGLQYLHELDIVHADLKAKNVLVSRMKRAIIADFGISRISMTLTTTTANPGAGTANWMAPELLLDDNPIPKKQSDIWAFGCLCYEVLSGKMPFYQFSAIPQLIRAFMKGNIIPLRTILEPGPRSDESKEIWPLAEQCWDYTPESRPTSDALLYSFSQLNMYDDRPPDEEFRLAKGAEVDIDYNRVHDILQQIREFNVRNREEEWAGSEQEVE